MALIRLVVTAAGLLLMVGGYFASQQAYFSGTTAQYTQSLSKSPVWSLSLVLLGAAVVLALIPAKEADQG